MPLPNSKPLLVRYIAFSKLQGMNFYVMLKTNAVLSAVNKPPGVQLLEVKPPHMAPNLVFRMIKVDPSLNTLYANNSLLQPSLVPLYMFLTKKLRLSAGK